MVKEDWGEEMKEISFNMQVTIVIIIGLLVFGVIFVSLIWANMDIHVTYDIIMDNNTLEAIKSIDWTALK